MITLFCGDNTFETTRAVEAIVGRFSGTAERIDGSSLELKQLPDLLMGATLFAEKRLVIIKNLSENKAVWATFSDWLPRLSDDIELVLIDAKPDKRTTSYKELKKLATITELNQWTDRDENRAEKWVLDEAKRQAITIDMQSVQFLVRRVGLDQWQLFHALEKLGLSGAVTREVIEATIDANPVENVFNLFDAALRGNGRQVVDMIRTLELSEDPYRLFALLSSQVFQLATVVASGPSDVVAKDFGVHPYAVSKLVASAKRHGMRGIRHIICSFAEADDDMKLSRAEPWLLIERTLMKVASQ